MTDTQTVVYEPIPGTDPDAGLFFEEISCPAVLKTTSVTPHTNGATYEVQYLIPVSMVAELALSPDGADVFFDDHIIGEGGIANRIAITSGEGMKKGLVVLRFSQSEIAKSFGWLGDRVQMGVLSGILRFSPSQGTLNLSGRA